MPLGGGGGLTEKAQETFDSSTDPGNCPNPKGKLRPMSACHKRVLYRSPAQKWPWLRVSKARWGAKSVR